MKFMVELIAVFVVGVLHHALGSYFYIKKPDYSRLFTASEQLLRRWLEGISGIVVVLLVALNQPEGLSSVGIQNKNNGNAIWEGWLAVSALLIVSGLIFKLIQRIRKVMPSTALDTSQPWIAEDIKYRDQWERFAYLTVLALDVISEDLIYRGYFVLLLGYKTGTFIPWAIISVIFSVIIHLYQGRNIKTVLFHAVAASFLVALTIATQNILAPIAAHLYFDFMTTMQAWKLAKEQGIALPATQQSRLRKIAYAVFIGTNILFLWFSTIWVFG